MIRFLSRFVLSFLFCVLFLSPCLAEDFLNTGALNAAQTSRLLADHEQGAMPALLFLDVRTQHEFLSGHVPGALNIPVNELGRRLSEIPDGPVVIICRSGRRAQNAYNILTKNGRRADQLWFYVGYTDYSSGRPLFRD